MTQHAFEDLLHRAVDGEASPADLAQVKELLDSDPQARRLHGRLLQLRTAMTQLGSEDAPPRMKERILREVSTNPPTRTRGWHAVWDGMRRRIEWSHLYAFAGGGAIAVVAFLGLGDSLGPTPHAAGTLARIQDRAEISPVQQSPITLDGMRGFLRLFGQDGGSVVEIELEGSGEAMIQVILDPSLRPLAFEQENPGAESELRSDRFLVRHRGGNRYRLILGGQPTKEAPMRVELTSGGARLEYTLPSSSGS